MEYFRQPQVAVECKSLCQHCSIYIRLHAGFHRRQKFNQLNQMPCGNPGSQFFEAAENILIDDMFRKIFFLIEQVSQQDADDFETG